jgi:hypothetical protein
MWAAASIAVVTVAHAAHATHAAHAARAVSPGPGNRIGKKARTIGVKGRLLSIDPC